MNSVWVGIIVASKFISPVTAEFTTWRSCLERIGEWSVYEYCDTRMNGAWYGPPDMGPPPLCQIQISDGPVVRVLNGRWEGVRQNDAYCIEPSGKVWRIRHGGVAKSLDGQDGW